MTTISWERANKQHGPTSINVANEDWDKMFQEINLRNIKPQFRDMYLSIKGQYETNRALTNKQAHVVRTCWTIHQRKVSANRGVSPRSFRGIPRMVNEGLY